MEPLASCVPEIEPFAIEPPVRPVRPAPLPLKFSAITVPFTSSWAVGLVAPSQPTHSHSMRWFRPDQKAILLLVLVDRADPVLPPARQALVRQQDRLIRRHLVRRRPN